MAGDVYPVSAVQADRGRKTACKKVDKWFPSSKTCCVCGKKKEELALSERVYICECGNIMDRDQNASNKHKAGGDKDLRHSVKNI